MTWPSPAPCFQETTTLPSWKVTPAWRVTDRITGQRNLVLKSQAQGGLCLSLQGVEVMIHLVPSYLSGVQFKELFIFVCTCVHVLICVHTCACIYIYAYMHVFLCCVCTRMHVYMYGYVHLCVEYVSPHSVYLCSWEASCLQFQPAETVLVHVSLWA